MKTFIHTPVLLREAVEGLNVSTGKKFIDATLGGGGHSREIIVRGGLVLGVDQDEEALEFVRDDQRSNIKERKLTVAHGNFRDIKKVAVENGYEKADGILFDLGVSSYQLDSSGRGFSIKKDENLDMRMDASQTLSAYEVVNSYPKEKLIEIFYKYGEEHNARNIAEEIVIRRKKNEIKTTKELAEIIERIPHKSEPIHPATRTFQAVRIEVNGELEAIKIALRDSMDILNTDGRLVVISFHSLEDRIVKQMFEQFRRSGMGNTLTKKPVTSSDEEVNKNKRSRSAKMRVFERRISG